MDQNDSKAFFMFEKISTMVECSNKDEMCKIFDKFANKVNSTADSFNFLYQDKKINKNDTIIDLTKSKATKEIVISVEKKLKKIKCPICICNDTIINIDNYKLVFYNCKYKHNLEKIVEDYEESQKLQITKIKCDVCRKSQKDIPADFYKCLKCTQINGRTIYLCSQCNLLHNEKHKRINYDEKNYFCEQHYKELKFYCNDCQKDLCDECAKNHKCNHIIKYESINIDIKSIKDNINNIKEKIEDLKSVVNNLKNNLDCAMEIISKYYEIAKDIIEKYELYNTNLKNHRILKSIENLNKSNQNISIIINEIIKIQI